MIRVGRTSRRVGPVETLIVVALLSVGAVASSAAGAGAEIEGNGYWVVTASGEVVSFGEAPDVGSASPAASVTDIESTPDGQGVWVLDASGAVTALGTALIADSTVGMLEGEEAEGLSSTPSGDGYWVFSSLGRVIPVGDAVFHGDLAGEPLNAPVIDAIATPSGLGYYLVAADGGIFAFGDAVFAGSMGGTPLNAPVVGVAPDPDGSGYWLVAADGGIFAFDADFLGSMGGVPLNQPVTGMVAHGGGYLMVAADGGVFNFSSLPFEGSLGNNPPDSRVVAITPLGDGTAPPVTDPPTDTDSAPVVVEPTNYRKELVNFFDGVGPDPRLAVHLYDGGGNVLLVIEGWTTAGEPLCFEIDSERAGDPSGPGISPSYGESEARTCGPVEDFTDSFVDCGDWAYVLTSIPAGVTGELYVATYDGEFEFYAFPDQDFFLGPQGALPPFPIGASTYELPAGILPSGTIGAC